MFLQKKSFSPSKHFFFFFKSLDQGSILRTFLESFILVPIHQENRTVVCLFCKSNLSFIFQIFFLKRCKNADTSYPELQRLHCEVPLPSFRSIIYYLPCKPRLILHKSLQAKGQNHTTSTSGRISSPRRSKKGCGASQVIGKMQQLRQDLD